MENEVLNTQASQAEAIENESVVEDADFYSGDDARSSPEEKTHQDEAKTLEFRFFRNCAASLKRFSILIFVINLFIAIGITGALTVVLAINLGTQMLSLLALPIITVFVILVVLARFISALVYGFAEIVEKAEKN